jgi:hypothetical protein
LKRRGDYNYADPIKYWRRLSSVSFSILNIAAELNQDRLGEDDDWLIATVGYMHGGAPLGYRPTDPSHGRYLIGTLVTDWMGIGGVTPVLCWSEERSQWEMVFGPVHGSPFGAIGLALMMAVSEKDGLAICSNCHKSYLPTRRPNPRRRNYCPTCGKLAAWRDATRAARAKRRVVDIESPARKRH